MKSIKTGSPTFFLTKPASELRRLLKMPLDLSGFGLRSKTAEWRELIGKKSEFSRRKPRKNGFVIFESLSIRRWFGVELFGFSGCCLGLLFGDSDESFEGKNRAKSQSLSKVASSISFCCCCSLMGLATDCYHSIIRNKKLYKTARLTEKQEEPSKTISHNRNIIRFGFRNIFQRPYPTKHQSFVSLGVIVVRRRRQGPVGGTARACGTRTRTAGDTLCDSWPVSEFRTNRTKNNTNNRLKQM